MARYTGPVCRLCRREGMKLFLKGDRCYSDRCSFNKRDTPPGLRLHAFRRFKMSDYGIRLREKQKLRRIYGLMERQFRKTFNDASRMKENTGVNLLQLLERRLDNVVFRLGFAPSRAAARQLITHGHFEVNGRKVDIPSFRLRPGDTVAVREKSKKLDIIHHALRQKGRVQELPYLEINKARLEGKLLSVPERESIPVDVNELFVVEFYSR